jgi:hypothetical protein
VGICVCVSTRKRREHVLVAQVVARAVPALRAARAVARRPEGLRHPLARTHARTHARTPKMNHAPLPGNPYPYREKACPLSRKSVPLSRESVPLVSKIRTLIARRRARASKTGARKAWRQCLIGARQHVRARPHCAADQHRLPRELVVCARPKIGENGARTKWAPPSPTPLQPVPPRFAPRDWAHPDHICAGTVRGSPTACGKCRKARGGPCYPQYPQYPQYFEDREYPEGLGAPTGMRGWCGGKARVDPFRWTSSRLGLPSTRCSST